MDRIQETIKHLPHRPGVYLYKGKYGTVIYVGKAKDLKQRVAQYFVSSSILPLKTQHLVSQIKALETKEVANEFDALLLEAKLIRKYNPKYNIIAKDDKSPIYIKISKKELLPHVSLARKPKNHTDVGEAEYFGPFQSRTIAMQILRTLRASIPFCMQKRRTGNPCFYTQLHLCDPCPSTIETMEEGEEKKNLTYQYRLHVRRLLGVLSGSRDNVLLHMEQEMKTLSQKQEFEKCL